ncbi:MAG TPA: trypsin-like serine protease [Polyangiaceae bacterium]|nr:trypsin-like serine protease [Polyangiaceae bacterium]
MGRWPKHVALALGWIAGCGSPASPAAPSTVEATATTTSAIEDGVLDTTHNFAVGIVQTSQLQSHQISVCSGALLAPNLVATARHCVSPLTSPMVDCGTSTFSGVLPASDLLITTDPQLSANSTFVGATQIVVPTGTDHDKVCGNDIALIVLDRSIHVPEYVVPVISPPMTDPMYSTSVTAIGYGIDSPTDMSGMSAGVRRIKQNIGLACIPNDGALGACFKSQGAQQVLAANEFVSGDSSTCDGDSGSSAFDQGSFDQGKWVSFGVLSRGAVSQDGQTCIQPIYTRFDAWRALLVETAALAASMGGYALPSWASALPDGANCSDSDQCASTSCVSTQGDAMTGVCASPCNGGSCASGLSCLGGYCFASPPQSPSQVGGCSAVPGAPTTPISLAVGWAGVVLLAVGRRRRR